MLNQVLATAIVTQGGVWSLGLLEDGLEGASGLTYASTRVQLLQG